MPSVLVTGANRGIGLEFVRQYAAEGWQVITCVRSPSAEKTEALSSIDGDVRIEALDVTDHDSIADLAHRLGDATVDLLINNAGRLSGDRDSRGVLQGLESIDFDRWTEEFKVNAQGPLAVTRALLDHLTRGKGRTVVNLSTGLGSLSRTDQGSGYYYRTSKAALNMVTRILAADLQERGIVVVSLDPGWVRTRMGGENAAIDPEESVAGLRRVIAALEPAQSGGFFNRKGETVPW